MSAPAALRDAWYDRLADDGFVDLESRRNPDGPIAVGPGIKASATGPDKPQWSNRNAVGGKAEYFTAAAAALNSDSLPAEWKRGRARKILELHCTGMWNRRIRDQVKCKRSTVEDTIRAFSEWLQRRRPRRPRPALLNLGRDTWRLTLRLTDRGTDEIHWLAEHLGCTPAQAARMAIREKVDREQKSGGPGVSTHVKISAAALREVATADGGSTG